MPAAALRCKRTCGRSRHNHRANRVLHQSDKRRLVCSLTPEIATANHTIFQGGMTHEEKNGFRVHFYAQPICPLLVAAVQRQQPHFQLRQLNVVQLRCDTVLVGRISRRQYVAQAGR